MHSWYTARCETISAGAGGAHAGGSADRRLPFMCAAFFPDIMLHDERDTGGGIFRIRQLPRSFLPRRGNAAAREDNRAAAVKHGDNQPKDQEGEPHLTIGDFATSVLRMSLTDMERPDVRSAFLSGREGTGSEIPSSPSCSHRARGPVGQVRVGWGGGVPQFHWISLVSILSVLRK